MPETRRVQRDPASAPVPAPELQIRITCKGKAALDVLDQLSLALAEAETRQMDPLIVLEDLGLLRDSVVTLIKGLCRLLVAFPRTVTFWESSGYTEAFLNVMEKQEPPGNASTVAGSIRYQEGHPMPTKLKGKRSTQEKDLVCGMEIDAKDAPMESFDGKSYVFCSEECREKFLANPSDYVIL